MGSGRSGTSMMGGILHDASYYTGPDLYPPRDGNPKGFFESPLINKLNELILEKYDRQKEGIVARLLSRIGKDSVNNLKFGQRWLSSIPLETTIECSDREILAAIEEIVTHKPFAYKDPRFSYTAPVWLPFLDESTVFICIFRSPDSTVRSMLKECSKAPNLKKFEISKAQAYDVWFHMYSHILQKHDKKRQIFYIHYLQILRGEGLESLSTFLETPLKSDFVDQSLNRTPHNSASDCPQHIGKLYGELCKRAGFVE